MRPEADGQNGEGEDEEDEIRHIEAMAGGRLRHVENILCYPEFGAYSTFCFVFIFN